MLFVVKGPSLLTTNDTKRSPEPVSLRRENGQNHEEHPGRSAGRAAKARTVRGAGSQAREPERAGEGHRGRTRLGGTNPAFGGTRWGLGSSLGRSPERAPYYSPGQRPGSQSNRIIQALPARLRAQASEPAHRTMRASGRRPPERPGKGRNKPCHYNRAAHPCRLDWDYTTFPQSCNAGFGHRARGKGRSRRSTWSLCRRGMGRFPRRSATSACRWN